MNRLKSGAAAASPEGARASRRPESMVAWGRAVATLLWPPAMVVAIYVAVGRLGFFPADEGLDLSYGYRMLMGQVPHRDFVSPRPVGSAILHLVDFAIPGPLFEVSRILSLCEFVAYTIAFAWLIYAVVPWRWSVAMIAATAGAVLINMNRFPLMAWYTVDGLLLVGAGFLIVRRGVALSSWPTIALGFVVLGLAALTKQSFMPAVALGWFLMRPRLAGASWPARLRDLIATGAYGALPGVLYVASIAAAGGMHALRAQLLGVAPVFGASLLYPWLPGRDLPALAMLTGFGLAIGIGTSRIVPGGRWSSFHGILMTLGILGVVLIDQLGLRSDGWGIRLLWMAVGFWLARALTLRSIDEVGLALIGVAWMASLSYSFFYPNLAGGTIALYLVQRSWTGATLPGFVSTSLLPATASILAFTVVGAVFANTRYQDVFDDQAGSRLTASLSGVSPAFGGIRTNPGTAQYLSQMKGCIQKFPARYVAVLPENAAIYPALGLRNPFPIDWIWPYDINGSETRIIATADELNRSGDYLVLFQTADDSQIIREDLVPNATTQSTIYAFTPLPSEIYARLNGMKTTCGSFLVVYSASPSS